MALNISKMTAANKVLAGTVVGIPTTTQGTTVIPCTHSLTTNPNNYFTVSGNDLVTAQSGPMAMGQDSLEVAATSISLWPNGYAYKSRGVTVPDDRGSRSHHVADVLTGVAVLT